MIGITLLGQVGRRHVRYSSDAMALPMVPEKLVFADPTAKITVVAISTTTGVAGALDGDPAADAGDYTAACGVLGGLPGQATRITGATGGSRTMGIDAGAI